jgi:hypothetical protein
MLLLTILGHIISTSISVLDRIVFFFQNLLATKAKTHLVHDLRGQFKQHKELSVEVSDPNHKTNETNPRRNVLYRDVLLSRPDQIKQGYDGVSTMDALFERAVDINGDMECLQVCFYDLNLISISIVLSSSCTKEQSGTFLNLDLLNLKVIRRFLRE